MPNHTLALVQPNDTFSSDTTTSRSTITAFSDAEIAKLTLDDFVNDTAVYEKFCSIVPKGSFQELQLKTKLDVHAKKVGFKRFVPFLTAFSKEQESKQISCTSLQKQEQKTAFPAQPIELVCGQWFTDFSGVYLIHKDESRVYACQHPITVVERLVNVETQEHKIKLAYVQCGRWKTTIVDTLTIASARTIVSLAALGIDVTSESARYLVRYLSDLLTKNVQTIPIKHCVCKLGYIKGYGFSPYSQNLIYDGGAGFQELFSSVCLRGDYDKWKEIALQARRDSVPAKLMLAASFASPLLEIVGCLCFFVHLWGVKSGTGKTVTLRLAASVWGNPALGKYPKTFDGTTVGFEKTAAFLNQLPLCLDELQLTRGKNGHSQFSVYRLAEGSGRTRGLKNGGVDKSTSWRNTILTTGESPLTSEMDGACAANRVIDIPCSALSPVLSDCNAIASCFEKNYGHAGYHFAKNLYANNGENLRKAKEIYRDSLKKLKDCSTIDSTGKQTMAMAAILTADKLACEWVFGEQAQPLTVEEVAPYLTSQKEVSLGERGYRFLCDWVAQNPTRFVQIMPNGSEYIPNGVIFGQLFGGYCYINRNAFNNAVNEQSINARSLLSYLRDSKLIDVREGKKGYTCTKRICGQVTDCVILRLPTEEEPPSQQAENLSASRMNDYL